MATAAYKGRFDINERAPEPRYVAIKQYVLHAISSGELKPGDRLQSEAELVQQFGVSRMTASRALRELQNAGIIVRLPGVGSFIAEPPRQGHIIAIRHIADEFRSRGPEYQAKVVQNVGEKFGRASSRERMCKYVKLSVVDVSSKKQKHK